MNKNTTALILIVLAAGIYFTVTSYMLDEARVIRDVNAQYISAITGAEQLIKVRDQVRKDFNNISEEDRIRMDKMLPNTVDNIRLIIDLNNLAFKHGLVLKSVTASAAPSAQKGPTSPIVAATGVLTPVTSQNDIGIPTPTLDSVNVSFGTTATYEQFLSLLQDIEANLRITDVVRLSLISSDSGQYEWAISLKTYWLKVQ